MPAGAPSDTAKERPLKCLCLIRRFYQAPTACKFTSPFQRDHLMPSFPPLLPHSSSAPPHHPHDHFFPPRVILLHAVAISSTLSPFGSSLIAIHSSRPTWTQTQSVAHLHQQAAPILALDAWQASLPPCLRMNTQHMHCAPCLVCEQTSHGLLARLYSAFPGSRWAGWSQLPCTQRMPCAPAQEPQRPVQHLAAASCFHLKVQPQRPAQHVSAASCPHLLQHLPGHLRPLQALPQRRLVLDPAQRTCTHPQQGLKPAPAQWARGARQTGRQAWTPAALNTSLTVNTPSSPSSPSHSCLPATTQD